MKNNNDPRLLIYYLFRKIVLSEQRHNIRISIRINYANGKRITHTYFRKTMTTNSLRNKRICYHGSGKTVNGSMPHSALNLGAQATAAEVANSTRSMLSNKR